MAEYVPRDIEPVLLACLEQFPALALTGPRQSGKTTLLRRALPDHRYLNLDDPLIGGQARSDPDLLLDTAGDRILLDEIQNAPSLLTHIKLRIDRERDRMGRFVLTGSQQFPVMKGLSESLAGRVGILELLPFALSEVERADAWSAEEPAEAFTKACLRGMYPELVTRPVLTPERWHASYVRTYIERDVRGAYDVGSLRDFERFLQLLAARCSQTLNMTALACDVGVAVNTIKRWLSILEAGRVIVLLPPFHTNLGKRIVKAPKVYFLDCGLVCYLTRVRDAGHLLHGPMAGALFECFCVQEAVKAILNCGAEPRLSYLRTASGLEVDLIVEGAGGALHPFEFKLARTPRIAMASTLVRFRREFSDLSPMSGHVVSLSDRTDALAADVSLAPPLAFVRQVALVTVAPGS
jgi:predicted AAA+ superfamily ATPase